jgi:hypothetical protein
MVLCVGVQSHNSYIVDQIQLPTYNHYQLEHILARQTYRWFCLLKTLHHYLHHGQKLLWPNTI